MAGENFTNSMNRRQFLAYSAAGAAGLLLPTQAAVAGVTDIADVVRLLRLHPVRFFAGLVFDFARAVLVDFASDAVVAALREGRRPLHVVLGESKSRGEESAAEFRHTNYKASTVVLGVADYEAYKERELRLLLTDPQQKARFQTMVDYLRSEGIRVKLAGASKSDPLDSRVSPDNPDALFMLDYIQMEKHQADHYRNLIAATGTTAFNNWSV